MPVRYHRNDQNLGATANILNLANALAEGQFCWILGDDDLVRDNAVPVVIKALELHPELDYVFVNHSYEFVSDKEGRPALATGADYPALRNLVCSEAEDQVVDRWEDIIRFSKTPALFTSIVSHVFRLSRWRDTVLGMQIESDSSLPFSSLEGTFPHVCVLARMMIGRPALYLGFPHVIFFVGAQEWLGLWPMMQIVRVLELSDLFENLRARQEMVDLYRNLVFRGSSEYFWMLLTNPSQPGREHFSFSGLAAKYWRYRSFWRMITDVPCTRSRAAVRRFSRMLFPRERRRMGT